MMVSDSDDCRLRDRKEQLTADDAGFVDAFRSRSSLMDDAPQLHADLHVLGECLVRTAAALFVLLRVRGSYAGAAGLCMLLLAVTCHGRGSAPTRTRRLHRRRPLDRHANRRCT